MAKTIAEGWVSTQQTIAATTHGDLGESNAEAATPVAPRTSSVLKEKVTVTMTRIAVGTCGVEPTTALVPALMTLTIAA